MQALAVSAALHVDDEVDLQALQKCGNACCRHCECMLGKMCCEHRHTYCIAVACMTHCLTNGCMCYEYMRVAGAVHAMMLMASSSIS